MPISTFRVINLILFLLLILSSCEQKPLRVEDENLSLSSDTITFNIVDDITYQIPPNMSGSKHLYICLLYTSPSPRDGLRYRMPSSA